MTEEGISRPVSALIAAFLLAIIHQYLFYGKLAGVSYPIFVSLFYIFMLYYAKDKIRKPTGFSYILLGVIALLSLTNALFHNWFFFGLNLLVIPVLIILHMTYMLSDKRPSWSGIGIIGNALEHFFPQTLRHWNTVLTIVKKTSGRKLQNERKQVLVKVLIGLAISFPLLLIVISLLSSADGVFKHILNEFPTLLDRISFGEGLVRVLWVVVLGLGFFGLVWGFVDSKIYNWTLPQPNESELELEPTTFKVDPVIITTILVAINTVYVLFVFVQFSYLFGAWEGILPADSSYADYARSGFFELIMVTAINFVILMLALLSSEKGNLLLHRIIKVLLYVLVGCSTVMLYSAYTRLTLYEQAYGYTYIRFLVHSFMIFLALLLCLAAIRISKKEFPLAKCYIVLGLLSYVVMNYIGMDVIIANNNIDRYEVSSNIDAAYLSRLSPEAIPTLISFSRKEGGLLDSNLRDELVDFRKKERSWQSFNVSEYRAERALERYFRE